ncbi:hypothetical protein D9611_011259 [Ephemerocybe angulata]|uniref:non-specific serine/threonine protein kinase n=1 Tax=Ephemerocybe angulata TaxID=980116 RepID=A0A8H5BD26_9AGAR|nr:hypothetical protein D9611_011259 [Tulosesus angulatus]
MSPFPEEPLNLSTSDGFGYFPGEIKQSLNNGRYTIIRKLGWGPRSSTWLVRDSTEKKPSHDSAVQIFTAAKSREADKRLLPVLQSAALDRWVDFPTLVDSFWEASVHGEHLCIVIAAYGLPFGDLLVEATNRGRAGLPVGVVKYVAWQVLEVLVERLHHKKGLS